MAKAYDAIIIGTGQAGPPFAKRLSEAGMSVAVIERHLFGGTCVNTGCLPTKTMVASAYAAHVTRVRFLTNSSMMDLDVVPEHLVIVGGSYVGLEFGQMFRRFGAQVTIVEMAPRLVQREDEDISAAIASA
jgi:pyruvate/2-oxoglutarate dehydrogenase complex dihydrolipoamide dehydrogenase (E3) component